jgi:hypothetical protein
MELHVRRYLRMSDFRDVKFMHVAANVRLHGTSPWHLEGGGAFLVAANVKDHGTSPWHPKEKGRSSKTALNVFKS